MFAVSGMKKMFKSFMHLWKYWSIDLQKVKQIIESSSQQSRTIWNNCVVHRTMYRTVESF